MNPSLTHGISGCGRTIMAEDGERKLPLYALSDENILKMELMLVLPNQKIIQKREWIRFLYFQL